MQRQTIGLTALACFFTVGILCLLALPFTANAQANNCKLLPMPSSVTVKLNTYAHEWNPPQPPGTPITLSMEDYVWGVLVPELGSAVPAGPYTGQSWDTQVIQAQAVAARTIGAFKCKNLTDTLPQQFRPNWAAVPAAEKTRFQNKARVSKGMYLTYNALSPQLPFVGKVIDAEYRSDVGNPTCSWNSGLDDRSACWYNGSPVSDYPYLKSVANPYAINTAGPGFGQRSAHSWRKADDKKASYSDVLRKYYTGTWIQNDYYLTYNAKFYNQFDQSGCMGSIVQTVITTTVNVYWPQAPYGISGVNADNFCVRWETSISVDASDWYTFYILRDDGMRLRIDGNIVLDLWSNSVPDLQSVAVYLTAGTPHPIVLDLYDSGYDAVARLSINRSNGMIGRYYPYIVDPSGAVPDNWSMLRPDMPAKFDWVNASPLDTNLTFEPGQVRIPANNFSVIWQGHIYVSGNRDVKFKARLDDGMIATISDADGSNQRTLFDAWQIGPPRSVTDFEYLTTGTYKVQVRYFEQTVNAVATFDWLYWNGNGQPEIDPDTEE